MTDDEREERRFDRGALLACVAAALFFAWHGCWLLAWLVAGAWLLGFVSLVGRAAVVYVPRRRDGAGTRKERAAVARRPT